MMEWRGDGEFGWPFQGKDPVSEALACESGEFGPFGDLACCAVYGDEDIDGAVAGLLLACGPGAIFLAVVFISIDSFDGVFGCWLGHHVATEIVE